MSLDAKKDYKNVHYLTQKPSRVAQRMGIISCRGNEFASFEDLIMQAKKKAAKLGGDFILAENSGVHTETVYSPGHSSSNANSNLSWGSHSGQQNSSSTAYSEGPSFHNISRPWGDFSVWIFSPAQLGIRLDDNNTVVGFHLNSDAEKAGVKLQDKIVGIDGYDIMEEKVVHHFLTIQPGDKIKIALQRDKKLLEFQVTALEN